jgi:hypothetical protein
MLALPATTKTFRPACADSCPFVAALEADATTGKRSSTMKREPTLSVSADREPEPGAALVTARLHFDARKRNEQAREVARVNADARVRDLDDQVQAFGVAPRDLRADAYLAASGEFHGVADQVDQDLS